MRHINNFPLIAILVVLAFLSTPAVGQISKNSDLDLQAGDFRNGDLRASLAASAPTCMQPPAVIRIPNTLAQRAKIKARLADLLRQSLYDDASGIVNVAREKEIRKLANKIRGRE